jgi:predicted nucleic acid-binding protein
MVFADANVVLELLLFGRQKAAVVSSIIAQSPAVAISMLTVHLAHYFGKKEGMKFDEVAELLVDFIIEDLTKEDYKLAQKLLVANDFEDALQLAVALRIGCDRIITLDKTFARDYADKIEFELV